MIQAKYLIIIALIFFLIIIYYLHNEISSLKKMLIPTYQKTMALESKINDQEKRIDRVAPTRNDSPVFSMSYQSDMAKNGNLSVKYVDLSETEANELLKNIDNNKDKKSKLEIKAPTPIRHNKVCIPDGDFSDLMPAQNNRHADSIFEQTDTINVNVADIINRDTNQKEYQNLLNGLSKDIPSIHSESSFSSGAESQLDEDVIKSITESIQYADMPSETILSDIPIDTTKKKARSNARSKRLNK